MFDVGFTEFLLVAVIGLLVLGPERLPVAMRTVGRGLGQARRAMGMLRTQVARELDNQALNQTFDSESLRRLEQELRQDISLPAQSPSSTNGSSS